MITIRAQTHLNVHQLNECIAAMQSGKIVCYPTETFYALGVDASNDEACSRLFAAKHRDPEKNLPVIAANETIVAQFCETSDARFKRLASKYWPGPLTIVLPALRNPNESIAVRVSSNNIAQQLSKGLGGLIVSTSANFSGEPPAQTVDQISAPLLKATAVLIDAGACPGGLPSTIVSLLEEKTAILRAGAIPESEIISFLASE